LQPRLPDASGGQPSRAPEPAATEAPASQAPASQAALRLVASRPMWDGGAFVQHSPSLASLHPPVELRANPEDLRRLGIVPGSRARADAPGRQAGVVVTAIGDADVPAGTVVLPFNLPGGGAGQLIDASSPVTEISLEKLEG
jgi:anaerobic selenocysteine-containing dehydrogenase